MYVKSSVSWISWVLTDQLLLQLSGTQQEKSTYTCICFISIPCLVCELDITDHRSFTGHIWHPHSINDTYSLERIQQKATKFILELDDYSFYYKQTLIMLNLNIHIQMSAWSSMTSCSSYVTSKMLKPIHFKIFQYLTLLPSTRSSLSNLSCLIHSFEHNHFNFFFIYRAVG